MGKANRINKFISFANISNKKFRYFQQFAKISINGQQH